MTGPTVTGTASWRRAARLDTLSGNAAVGVELDERPVCLSLVDGVPVAVRDLCGHRAIALSGGLVRDGVLTCPGHFWRYDLRTGRCLTQTDRLPTYPCRVVDGWVEVLVPPPPAAQSVREMLLAAARAPRDVVLPSQPVRPAPAGGRTQPPLDPGRFVCRIPTRSSAPPSC